MIRFYNLLILLMALSFPVQVAAVDVDAGLIGFWGFEEGTGTVSVNDSQLSQQAQLVNGPIWASGKIGGSLYFNGESSYVSLGNDDIFACTGQCTLAAWVKLNNPNYAAYTRIISKKYNWSDAAGYELEYNASTNRLALIGGGSNIAYALNVDLDTNWHHVAAVVNGTSVQLYVDGQAVAMTDAEIAAIQAGDAPLHIARNASAAAPFIGCIDEVRIYDQALTADVIAAMTWTGLGQRVIQWSGYNWLVKNAAVMGPGPNAWNHDSEAVWVDENGHLHLKVTNVDGQWHCAEVISKKVFDYGSYNTVLASDLAAIDPQMVLGVFVYKDDTHEVDVEYSAWGDNTQPAFRQFVQQPYYQSGNLYAMPGVTDGAGLNYQIDWLSDAIVCSAGDDMHQFANYTAVANPHMHLNLWLFQGLSPQQGVSFEVVFSSFSFTPEADIIPDPDPETTDAYLHWPLEDGSGLIASEISDLGLDAQVSDAAWQVDAQRDGFVYFDGNQDALIVPDAPGLDIIGNRSISFWLRNDRPNKSLYQRLLSKKNHWTDQDGFEVVYHPRNNELQLVGAGSKLAYSRAVDLDTNWHHVVITVIGSQAQFYIDGQASAMNKTDVGTISDNNLDLYVGRMGGGYGDFKGGLDDIRLYDYALDEEAINSLFVEGVGGVN